MDCLSGVGDSIAQGKAACFLQALEVAGDLLLARKLERVAWFRYLLV